MNGLELVCSGSSTVAIGYLYSWISKKDSVISIKDLVVLLGSYFCWLHHDRSLPYMYIRYHARPTWCVKKLQQCKEYFLTFKSVLPVKKFGACDKAFFIGKLWWRNEANRINSFWKWIYLLLLRHFTCHFIHEMTKAKLLHEVLWGHWIISH